jgi:hypothetical protein
MQKPRAPQPRMVEQIRKFCRRDALRMHNMGYLSPDFDYDLFISYAHGDFDKAGSSPLKVGAPHTVSAGPRGA